MTDNKQVSAVAKRRPPAAGMGRKKGSANKITTAIKEAIIAAANAAHDDGMIGYLTKQAQENPTAFLPLLGKIIPTQIAGDPESPVIAIIERRIVSQRPDD